jgi:hypothetical protein
MSEHPPVILFSTPSNNPDEYQKEKKEAEKHFVVLDSRMKIFRGDLVIGRYSVLPCYRELEYDLFLTGSKLINSHRQHRYVADIQNWYYDLTHLTPKTWFRMEDVPDTIGPCVLKGETNSKKFLWSSHMFAKNKQEAIETMIRLQMDGFVGQQQICIREYVHLVELAERSFSNQPPITLEYRFFCCRGKIVCGGYYWSNHMEEVRDKLEIDLPAGAVEVVTKALSVIGNKVEFVVVDVAKTLSGDWIVIELNDAQQSGLSECSPKQLYSNLKKILWTYKPPS